METPYTLIRSARKTMSLGINEALEVVVRAPSRVPQSTVDAFVRGNTAWIIEHTERVKARVRNYPPPTEKAIAGLKQIAAEYIPGRVKHYAGVMGLHPAGISITEAKTRFGSCSGKNRVCFSCLVMRYPPEAIDYVIVHELAHIAHKNHGKAFYALIEHILPDYRDRMRLLKT